MRVLHSVIIFISMYSYVSKAQVINDSLTIKNHRLGNVTIAVDRTQVEALQASRLVRIISKSDIERTPAGDLHDLLRYVAGIDIRQRGSAGAQADISIRGGTYDQAMVLLNGINVTDPQTGHHNLNLPISLESIERIEILQGSATTSFGPNAFSGAINIITGNSSENHIRLAATAGNYGLRKGSFNVSNTICSFKHFISIDRVSSDGYKKNTDLFNATVFYQAKYSLKAGTFDFQTGLNKKDFGANSFYSLKYPEQYEDIKTGFASMKFQTVSRVRFSTALYLRRGLDHFELKRNNDSIPFNDHRTLTTGLNINVAADHRLGKISAGIDLRREHILSNILGYSLSTGIKVPGYENTFYSRSYERINTGIFAEHNFTLKKFIFNAGIRAQHNQSGTGIYPGMDISYRINSYMRMYSSLNRSLRMPTFTDMFYRSPVQQGSPDLKPEKAVSIEGGLKYSFPILKGYINSFYRQGQDIIDWVKHPSADSIIWRSMNHSQVNFKGVEWFMKLTPGTGHIQGFSFSYSLLKGDANHGDLISKYALDYLHHQLISDIDLRIAWKLYNSIRLTWKVRNGSFPDQRGAPVSYDPYWLCDTKLYWKGEQFSVFTDASNIFNTAWYDMGGIVQAGFWLTFGFTLDLNY
jgi:vitamin B12 transporter